MGHFDTPWTPLQSLLDVDHMGWHNEASPILDDVDSFATDAEVDAALSAHAHWYNVKDYGAVGNGVVDCTAAFTAAITAAGGGTVFVPPGYYRLDSIDVHFTGTRILGAGRESTVLIAKAGADAVVKIGPDLSNGRYWSTWEHLTINGDGKAADGVWITGPAQGHLFFDVRFWNCDVCVDFRKSAPDQADKNRFINVRFTDSNVGLQFGVNGTGTGSDYQQQLIEGFSFDTVAKGITCAGFVELTLISGQFQGGGAVGNWGIDSSANGGSIHLTDVIFERGGGNDLQNGNFTLRHCTIQDPILMAGSAVIVAEKCRFTANGFINATGSDVAFYDFYNTFEGGSSWNPTGAACRRYRWDLNGLEFNGPSNPGAFTGVGLEWGPEGTGAMDTSLYRQYPGVLVTPGNLFVGTGQASTASYKLDVRDDASSSSPVNIEKWRNDSGPGIVIHRARTSGADVVNGDGLFRLDAWGRSAGAFGYPRALGALLDFTVDAAPSAAAMPTRLSLILGRAGVGPTEALRIDNAGKVWFDPGIAQDTNLYRGAANRLQTDDMLQLGVNIMRLDGDAGSGGIVNVNGIANQIFLSNSGGVSFGNATPVSAGVVQIAKVARFIGAPSPSISGIGVEPARADNHLMLSLADAGGAWDYATAGSVYLTAGMKLAWASSTSVADTNLYRSGANNLKTDSQLVVGGQIYINTAAGGTDTYLERSGFARARFGAMLDILGASGSVTALQILDTTAGAGMTIGGDVNLYRNAANVLKTDDTFLTAVNLQAAGLLQTDGWQSYSGAVQTIKGVSNTSANNLLIRNSSNTPTQTFDGIGNVALNVGGTHLEFLENGTTDAAAGVVNTGRIYVRDNGAGKTQLCVRFNTGAVQVLATEP